MGDDPAAIFVYGTLMPGAGAWPLLAGFATGTGVADAVSGVLFDTGLGWPSAMLDPAATTVVHGRWVPLRPDAIDGASDGVWATLDDYEDVADGHYERIIVDTCGARRAWMYVATTVGDGFGLLADGRWPTT